MLTDASTSYISRAGKDHSYFDLGDKWAKAYDLVRNDNEMWRINKKFIDQQKALGKEFYLSHNPSNPNFYMGFYKREIDYLTNRISSGGLGGTIEQVGANLWKVNF